MLLPASVEDYVSADNPVRAIAAYVDTLDLEALGFARAAGALTAGQPAYAPAHLLKLYLYGYLNRVRSSRRLAAECERNLEVIWLLGGLCPSYHTIADFRKANAEALTAANRAFVQLCRDCGLIGGKRLGVDGSFFNASASAASVATAKQLQAELSAFERDIERYQAELDANDAAEEAEPTPARITPEQLQELTARAEQRREQLQALEEGGETQVSHTDPDARRLSKNGRKVTGYNVQSVVDAKHKLIVEHAVTNAGNDFGQLLPMAERTIATLGLKTPPADLPQASTEGHERGGPLAPQAPVFLADTGYYTEADIAACQTRGITIYVPLPENKGTACAEGRLPGSAFRYDPQQDVYHCPAEHVLPPQGKPTLMKGVLKQRYASKASECAECPLREQCLPEKTPVRQIYRSEHADAVDRHRAHMQGSQATMRERAALCEHPFGTMKRWLGWDHFLVRGFTKVRGEMALLVHCYNFRRLLSIFGVARFIDLCRQRQAAAQAGSERAGLFARFAARARALVLPLAPFWPVGARFPIHFSPKRHAPCQPATAP
jgi:transposase